jgi:hypothetical protein
MIKKLAELAKKSSSLNVSNEKLYEMIKRRAYENYCKRGYSHGHDKEDWYIAEKQVKRELGLSR